MKKIIDLRGMVFGKLTVLCESGRNRSNKVTWWCLCECGELTIVSGDCLKRGHTMSCGCLRKERLLQANTIHGLSKHALHNKWRKIKDRCYNMNNKDFKYYGGKGIVLCNEWSAFIDFYKWAESNGYKEGLTIDRINPKGNYCPENCEFITQSENSRRSNITRKYGELDAN